MSSVSNIIFFYSLLLMLSLCISCEKPLVDYVYSIKIQNNTTDTIQFYASYFYPDTAIINEKPRLKNSLSFKVQ